MTLAGIGPKSCHNPDVCERDRQKFVDAVTFLSDDLIQQA